MAGYLFLYLLTALTLLSTTVQGYDEAHCNARSHKSYETGINRICRLPRGASLDVDDNDTTVAFNLGRCGKNDQEYGLNTVYGILASFLAAVMFGSMFVPIKKFETGDGMYFQWLMAIGSWIVGLIINLCRNPQPPFFSLSMVGGALWATGNIFSVPSFSLIGIGMGQTMVGNINLLGGWITGRFIFCQHIGSKILNTVGVVLVIVSSFLLSFVKSDGSTKNKQRPFWLRCFKTSKKEDKRPLLENSDSNYSINMGNSASISKKSPIVNSNHIVESPNDVMASTDSRTDQSWLDKLKQTKFIGKAIGLSLAILSGTMYGFQFLPIELLRRCDHDAFSCIELDYVFGMYVGILFTSTIWFFLYSVLMKFKPQINIKLTVPGLISGIMFGIGTASWLISNQYVGLPISFPIITAGASIISCLWGVLVFQEITGKKNLLLFLFAFLFVVAGIVIVGVSFK